MVLTPDNPANAQIWIRGEAPNQILDVYVPRGSKGDPGGFTFGTLLAVDTNLNQILVSGIYRQPSTPNGTTNYPMTAAGILTVFERLNDATYYSVIQEYYPVNTVMGSGVSYRRYYYSNSTWTPWRAFTSTRVDQTAGRAIYQWDDVNGRDQLLYGDTGPRDIRNDQAWVDALFPTNIVPNAGNIVRVRRVGYEVELLVALDKNATGSISSANAFPLGFRPALPVNAMGSNSGLVLVRVYHGGGATGINWNSTAVATAASVTMKYTTADPWPTTLPGSAIGSIPNT